MGSLADDVMLCKDILLVGGLLGVEFPPQQLGGNGLCGLRMCGFHCADISNQAERVLGTHYTLGNSETFFASRVKSC